MYILTQNKHLGRIGLNFAICPIFMKFGTQNKLNMNILIGIGNLDTKSQVWANLVSKLQCAQFGRNLAFKTNRTC